jgi:hypothetical protein
MSENEKELGSQKSRECLVKKKKNKQKMTARQWFNKIL